MHLKPWIQLGGIPCAWLTNLACMLQLHPMDSAKYGKIVRSLLDRGLVRQDQFIEPKDAPLVRGRPEECHVLQCQESDAWGVVRSALDECTLHAMLRRHCSRHTRKNICTRSILTAGGQTGSRRGPVDVINSPPPMPTSDLPY